MAEINKPSDINKIWAASGDILAPSDSKISTGWQVEIPPRQYFNYIDNKQDQAIAHINQHGICVWDPLTEYQYSLNGIKSLCMGSNGLIYRTKQTNINKDPTLDSTGVNWEIAFSSLENVYSKGDSDARFMQRAANLSDITNQATARNNLSVYSQTQVDSKTTIASTAQAQALSNNDVLISPLKLAEAFTFPNQSFSTTASYQKLPGGLIIQCGSATAGANGAEGPLINFPIPFPNNIFALVGTHGLGSTSPAIVAVGQTSLTNFTFRGSQTGPLGLTYIAIGN